jgi:1,4-dihydroxy-2-naphthoate octaprenyltransferase
LGGTLAIAYSLPPFSLASRGFGEATIAIAFGLPAWACAWLQSEQFGLSTLCAACAIGCWTANILIANEIPDIKADQQSGKRTLVVRLRPEQVRLMYISVASAAAAATFICGMIALAPLWTILPPLLLFGVSALVPIKQDASRDQMTTAIRMTLALHLLGGLWLIVLAAIA